MLLHALVGMSKDGPVYNKVYIPKPENLMFIEELTYGGAEILNPFGSAANNLTVKETVTEIMELMRKSPETTDLNNFLEK